MLKKNFHPSIERAFDIADTQFIRGIVNSKVLLTPSTVKRVIDNPRTTRKLGILQPQFQFKFDPKFYCVTLDPGICYKDSQTEKLTFIGLHQGNLEFPDYCCQCMKPAKRYEVVELPVFDHPEKHVEYKGASKEVLERMIKALHYNRYWFAIPFCDEHDLLSGAIGFEVNDKKLALKFANLEYAKQFGKKNGITVKWMDASVMKVRLLTNIGFIGCLICAVLSVAFFLTGAETGSGGVGGTIFAVAAGILAVLSLFYRLKHGRAMKVSEE
jgi:hypothetical protein